MTIDTVILTVNEVIHGNDYAFVDLVVVDGIDLVTDAETGAVHGEGGRCRVWTDWSPDPAGLRATKFDYSLPPTRQQP
ncbi:hypothetical protein [Mycolicibacterium sediminis]|uniref:Uncharacterized protein n=1 Tax=Mycolicibacterium sediminis TaxID=1286180 RepID=A0A7I7QQK3_9MYCO|nr:hypothetical protein [Mycolicibacterium sediminis]BBY28126.1 hypothetical protein MSEDJ_22220 [Mycolicibacterium sediminis]